MTASDKFLYVTFFDINACVPIITLTLPSAILLIISILSFLLCIDLDSPNNKTTSMLIGVRRFFTVL